MFVRVIPSQGDMFGCLGSNPSARFDIDGATVVYNGLPQPVGTRVRWHPGGMTRGTKIVIFVEE